jgi:hypothetical protein
MAGGGKIINLGGAARALGQRMRQSLYSSAYGTEPASIRDIPANAWPNPLQPIPPFGPSGSEALTWNFWEGQNLNYTPRSDALYTADELRALSMYPLARMCIENVKDIVCGTEWQIGLKPLPGETQKERASRAKGDENIVNLSRFFEYPDGRTDWSAWSRVLVENMLTIDAGTVLVERSKRGKVSGLEVIKDGGSVSCYIDERGRTPDPPSIAYSLNWWGLPRTSHTTDELLYGVRNIVPRNTLASFMYGLSPTEGGAEEIKIGIERLNFTLAYYTAGSVPDVIQIAPPGIPPDKIKEAQQANNASLSGQLSQRRKWTILQGFQTDGKMDQILFPKEPLLADPFDEMHIRKICYLYGDAPQRLLKQMNRSSSESSQTAAEEEGIMPWVRWLSNLMNRIITFYMGMPKYEISFRMLRESDILKLMQADVGYVKSGLYTINERRELRDDDPRPEPQASELGIVTANGWLPIGQTLQPAPGMGKTVSSSKKLQIVQRGDSVAAFGD